METTKQAGIKLITSWSDYKIDPRYLIIVFLGSFVVAGQVYLNFQQGYQAVILSIVTTVGTELLLGRLILKKWIYPLSSIITGMGVSLLISSNLLWPYFVVGLLSILIKYLLRYKGGHIFNPNNIAVVLFATLFPHYAIINPKQWMNGYEMMVVILILGVAVVVVAKRFDVAFTFIVGFFLIALVRSFVFGAPLLAAIGPLLGASTQLFIFFMVTDPKTTPGTFRSRILFAAIVAIIDGIFRIERIPNAPFYALFLTSIFFMIPYRWYFNKRLSERHGLR